MVFCFGGERLDFRHGIQGRAVPPESGDHFTLARFLGGQPGVGAEGMIERMPNRTQQGQQSLTLRSLEHLATQRAKLKRRAGDFGFRFEGGDIGFKMHTLVEE
jgi:hypothetical protein